MKELKDLFKRHFTKELEGSDKTVYDLFEWQNVDVNLTNYQTGATILSMEDLEFPVDYSQNACNIIASKYFRRRGIPNGLGYEHSMREVADRMVGFWADALKEEGIIETEEEWQIFYDEMVYALLKQMWAPNSPQWFNTGLARSYGIKGDKDDLYYYDEEAGEVNESDDRYTRTQSSACFILSIEDKLLGHHSISEHYVSETKLFKGGSGVGTNFSSLRGVNEKLSSGGQSSGMMSFLQGLDRNAGAIKSGGTTRRAAKMVIVDVDHPEIEEFVDWKVKEEDKVRALGKMGYDTSMDGEAYRTVAGQNSNNSVRLNKEFMDAVINLEHEPDHKMTLNGRVDDAVNREVSVKELWQKINTASWACADPGLQFDDLFNAWHTCPGGEDGDTSKKENRINATNPCSEYAFLNDTACNLASINIFRFFDPETNKIDIERFSHLAGLIQLVLEASIYWGQFPTEDVARKSYLFRTTGLGLANAASLILALGYPYDSDEARNLIAALCGIMTGHSYYVSAMMAGKVGPFAKYEINSPFMKRVIRNHSRVAGYLTDDYEEMTYEPLKINHELLENMGFLNVSSRIKDAWKDAIDYGEANGYRNAQVSVIAPTGTISFAMDCGATSVEPFYNHVVFKKLVGGGSMEIVNPVMEIALKNLGYKPKEISDILGYMLDKDEKGYLRHDTLSGAPHIKPEHIPVFDTANTIRPEGHVLMVSAITPMISGSVSKTVNLPSDAEIEDVKKIHLLAYTTGAKAIAVYRDGCKASQPLSSGKQEEGEKHLEDCSYKELLEFARDCNQGVPNRRKPDGMRMSRTHAAKIGDIELYITIGFYDDGKIAEIFVSTDKDGTVVKGLLASLSKSISNMLQYNIPPEKISIMLRGQKYEPSGFVQRHPYIKYASSISDLISKVIDIECGDYSKCQVKPKAPLAKIDASAAAPTPETVPLQMEMEIEGEKLYGEVCSQCGSDRMVRNGTCKVCMDCGTTTGCS
ncbi:vitamin B12-dependent ribonucleotide reductase [Eubacterium limosum]|uniref:Vitamin B12-dependent ribonucleotide reductase n=2 Tax=root TaxID=1 RepID=A0ABT5UK12_EUBLI|nr:vitamin B12-dependent ribonucleotide reductase [Eubacterium limosum]MCB6569583.1 vitamin B12-dependent ribonucleotide reductase [Eubacterium limosum]MDE1469247.1 vitamin B12-dependent ribonucleotide reductase [Eubacterium limosum]